MNAAAIQITVSVYHLFAVLGAILGTGAGLGLWAWKLASSVKDAMREHASSTNHARGEVVRLDQRIDSIEHRVGLLEQEVTR